LCSTKLLKIGKNGLANTVDEEKMVAKTADEQKRSLGNLRGKMRRLNGMADEQKRSSDIL